MATLTEIVKAINNESPVLMVASPIPIVHPAYYTSINQIPGTVQGAQKQAAENFNWG